MWEHPYTLCMCPGSPMGELDSLISPQQGVGLELGMRQTFAPAQWLAPCWDRIWSQLLEARVGPRLALFPVHVCFPLSLRWKPCLRAGKYWPKWHPRGPSAGRRLSRLPAALGPLLCSHAASCACPPCPSQPITMPSLHHSSCHGATLQGPWGLCGASVYILQELWGRGCRQSARLLMRHLSKCQPWLLPPSRLCPRPGLPLDAVQCRVILVEDMEWRCVPRRGTWQPLEHSSNRPLCPALPVGVHKPARTDTHTHTRPLHPLLPTALLLVLPAFHPARGGSSPPARTPGLQHPTWDSLFTPRDGSLPQCSPSSSKSPLGHTCWPDRFSSCPSQLHVNLFHSLGCTGVFVPVSNKNYSIYRCIFDLFVGKE